MRRWWPIGDVAAREHAADFHDFSDGLVAERESVPSRLTRLRRPSQSPGSHLGDQASRTLDSLVGILGDALHANFFELRRDVTVQSDFRRTWRIVVFYLFEDFVEIVASECGSSGQDFVEHGAHAVDVRAVIDVAASLNLLGGHIVRGSLEFALRRERRIAVHEHGHLRHLLRFFTPNLGESPIEQQDFAEGAHQDICGLYIAMDDAVAMGVVECIRDLDKDRHHAVEPITVYGLSSLLLRQILNLTKGVSLHQLHGKEVVPFVISRELINRNRIRVLEHRCDARFAEETLLLEGIVCDLLKQALMCHDSAEMKIFAGLDQAFAAARDRLELRVAQVRVPNVLGQVQVGVLYMNDRIFVLRLWEETSHAHSASRDDQQNWTSSRVDLAAPNSEPRGWRASRNVADLACVFPAPVCVSYVIASAGSQILRSERSAPGTPRGEEGRAHVQ